MINDVIEHPITQALGLITIILGFVLDYFDKTEYFSWAAIAIFIIFVIVIWDVLNKKKMYDTEVLPIPIVINIDSMDSTEYVLKNLFVEIEKNTKFKNLKKNLKQYRNIVEDDLTFTYNGSLYDKERIVSFLQIVKYQIRKIKENTPNKVEFHLAYYARPAHGIFLGYVFAEEDLVLYQKNVNEDIFNPVAEIEKRNYKEAVNEYQKFNVLTIKKDETDDELLIGIKASSHIINFKAQSLMKYNNIIYLEAKHKGTIELDENWVLYAREIFTILNEAQTSYKKITIVHAMPEVIGVLLGMSVANHWSLMITQYDQGDYLEVMRMNEIKCFF